MKKIIILICFCFLAKVNGQTVTTFAGSTQGFLDGTGTNAKFYWPDGICHDTNGDFYVADTFNHRIRKVTPSGVVSTFAGSVQGALNGSILAATFTLPSSVVADAIGNIYVSDSGNHRIRKIAVDGTVTTLAGSSIGFADGTGTSAQFNNPKGLALDANNNLYVADLNNNRIRKITPSGVVTTFAGSTQGFADGNGSIAKFSYPQGLTFDANGNLFVADVLNNKIRKISSTGNVSTFAGSTQGFADGSATTAQFNNPYAVSTDSNGNIFVADTGNNRIRKINPSGNVSTIAGSTIGFADGSGSLAQFNSPFGVTTDLSGNVYVSDNNNHKIRKITITPSLYTYVPDDNFEQELINQGYDSVIDDYVLTANISSLTSLNVSSISIADLTGIQDFVSLLNLDCSFNQLTTLTISTLPNLLSLNCSHNQLTNLTLNNIPSLSYLDANSNQLATVNLSSLTSLTHLQLGGNQLSSLNVISNINLTQLECSFNLLTTLNVINNINLVQLECRNNNLTTLDITNLPNLSLLNFSYNQITTLNTSNSTSLIGLYCHFNQLTSLNLSNSPNLTELWCFTNNMTSLNVSGLSNLYNLWCYSNQLTSLNVSSLTNLIILKSYGNPLTTLNVGNLLSLLELWTGSTQISTLDVSLCPSLDVLYTGSSPNLNCIRVADVVAANANSNFIKDAIATYTDTACVLGLNGFTSAHNLEIYPNPNNGKFSINSNNEKVTLVSLFSLDGKLINTQKPNTLNPAIALPEISKGMYLVNIILESGTEGKSKIIIE